MTARSGWNSEAGQTTALVCAMLFTLTMFVALVVNVGQLVNRRVALQLVADAGAWSGATVQAIQLNHFAFWSRAVQNAYKYASAVSFGFRGYLFSDCFAGASAVAMHTYANAQMVNAALRVFPGRARAEAERHSLYNIDDLFPGERNNFDFSTSALSDGGVATLPGGNIAPLPLQPGQRLYTGSHAWSGETFTQRAIELAVRLTGWIPWAKSSAGSIAGENWQCITYIPPAEIISYRLYLVGPSGYKLPPTQGLFTFVWRVAERRATRAFFFDRLFGGNVVPPMTAVAVAKAVGGHVHEGQSRYRAKMVPISSYSATLGMIRDNQARRGRAMPDGWRKIVH